jgi:hypothetical protein
LPTLTPSLLERAETRWAELGTVEPDLIPAISMQRSLIIRAIDAVAQLSVAQPPLVTLAPERVADKLHAGNPALRAEPTTLPVTLLGPLVLSACDDLASGGVGDIARRVRACLDKGRIDMGSLLAASFDRNQSAIRVKALHEGISPDVLWLAAELAVGPAAHVAQRTVFDPAGGGPHPAIATALETWPHGYCPSCGSWPAFGEATDGARHLRCSFCGLGWRPRDAGCSYCGEAGQMTTVKVDLESSHHAVLCTGCGAYLKWLDLPAPTPFELLPVEDLASTALDVLAAQQGFGRPTLPELGGPERLPCETIEPPR